MTRTLTETQLSLPCGCIVTVWPHGRGDSPGVEAAVTGTCKAHSEGVIATIRRWRADAAAYLGLRAISRDPAVTARATSAVRILDRVLRLLGAEPEKSPEIP